VVLIYDLLGRQPAGDVSHKPAADDGYVPNFKVSPTLFTTNLHCLVSEACVTACAWLLCNSVSLGNKPAASYYESMAQQLHHHITLTYYDTLHLHNNVLQTTVHYRPL